MVPYSKSHSKVALSPEIPDPWVRHSIPNSKTLYGETKGAGMLIQHANLPEYSLYFVRLQASLAENISLIRDKPVYFLVVQLQNTLDFTVPAMPPLRLLEWSFNFLYAPVFDMDVSLKAGATYETFFLIVPEGFVLYFAKHHEMVHEFHKKTKEKKGQMLLTAPKVCPPAVMKQILQLRTTGLADLNFEFADALMTEIFAGAISTPYRKMPDDEEVIGKLYALHAYLQANANATFTRAALMQQFGLSPQQFNQGFSSIYGITPFTFLKYLRGEEDR